MSYPIKRCSRAYVNGAKCAGDNGGKEKCPHGKNQVELMHWWLGGFNDFTSGLINSDGEPVAIMKVTKNV